MNGVTLKSRFPEILAELPTKLDEVAEAGAELISGDAEAKAPEDEGDLKEAIHVEKVGKGTYAVVAGGPTVSDRDVFYAHMVENGTTHSAPEPFLIPALEEDKPEVVALAEAAVRSVG